MEEECRLLCALYCLCDKIQVLKIGEEVLEIIRRLIRNVFWKRSVLIGHHIKGRIDTLFIDWIYESQTPELGRSWWKERDMRFGI